MSAVAKLQDPVVCVFGIKCLCILKQPQETSQELCVCKRAQVLECRSGLRDWYFVLYWLMIDVWLYNLAQSLMSGAVLAHSRCLCVN